MPGCSVAKFYNLRQTVHSKAPQCTVDAGGEPYTHKRCDMVGRVISVVLGLSVLPSAVAPNIVRAVIENGASKHTAHFVMIFQTPHSLCVC